MTDTMPAQTPAEDDGQLAEVRAAAQRIVDRHTGIIRTHSAGCRDYHLECFAALVLNSTPAATTAADGTRRA